MNDSSLERAFDSIDTNKNSVIDAEELLATLKRLGITAATLEEAERILSQTDVDRAGLLSKREFLAVMDPLSEDPVIVKKSATTLLVGQGSCYSVSTTCASSRATASGHRSCSRSSRPWCTPCSNTACRSTRL